MGERAMSKQEVFHRMMSQSFVYRSHSCRHVNLKNNTSRVSVNSNAELEPRQQQQAQIDILKTIVEMYGERTQSSNWLNDNHYEEATRDDRSGLLLQQELKDLTLDQFCSVYTSGKQGAHKNKIKKAPEDTFVRFKPRLQSDENLPSYGEYCKFNLIRYKIWNGNISNAYGGRESTEIDWKRLWKEHIQQLATNHEEAPDYAIRELQRLMNQLTPVQNDLVGGDGMDEELDAGEEVNISNFGLIDGIEDMDDDEFELAEFSNTLQDHISVHNLNEAGTFEEVRLKKDTVIEEDVNN